MVHVPTKTVFDCDDTLLNLCSQIFPVLGLPELKSFYYKTSGQYTPKQVDLITDAFSDVRTFMNAKFFEGADEIIQLERYGTVVHICSRSFNQQIIDFKKKILPEHTGVPLEHIDLQLGVGEKKVIPIDADVVVEDHLDNLLNLPSYIVRILIDKSYNRQSLREDVKQKIFRVPNLLSAIKLIRFLHISGEIYDIGSKSIYYNKQIIKLESGENSYV